MKRAVPAFFRDAWAVKPQKQPRRAIRQTFWGAVRVSAGVSVGSIRFRVFILLTKDGRLLFAALQQTFASAN